MPSAFDYQYECSVVFKDNTKYVFKLLPENTTIKTNINSSSYDSINSNGSYRQVHSFSGKEIPFEFYFYDTNSDKLGSYIERSNKFYDKLHTKDIITFTHPSRGKLKVIVSGSIVYNDSPNTTNSASITTTFVETTKEPSKGYKPKKVNKSIEDINNDKNAIQNKVTLDTLTSFRFSKIDAVELARKKLKQALVAVDKISSFPSAFMSDFNNEIAGFVDDAMLIVNNPKSSVDSLINQSFLSVKLPFKAINETKDAIEHYTDWSIANTMTNDLVRDAKNTFGIPTKISEDKDVNTLSKEHFIATKVIEITESLTKILDLDVMTEAEFKIALKKLSNQADSYLDVFNTLSDDNYHLDSSVIQGIMNLKNDIINNYKRIMLFRKEEIIKLDRNITVFNACNQYYGNIENQTINFFIYTNDIKKNNLTMILKKDTFIKVYREDE